MVVLVMVLWFVCGLAAIHLISEMHEVDPEVEYSRKLVWMALLGPCSLFSAILYAIVVALTKEKTR